ncbi:Uncharacterized protein, UPF0212 family [Natronorubrum sediminis]|uniref:UPF0212 protein SAMN04487967_2145 n=1 Tax=Natronorubrum sediminis TaxID=640943 RepID=A0A1H6G0Q3_9EURY|nr:DUF555 domain-containing protein [Natronorubrum sediminis]SEH15584.1 Uncharacterized protein, UPF0212 family [Natronorubrum sediminis]
MHCRVVVEAAVPVFDVETEDEAIRIAISKTGEMLNPDLNYVEINMGERTSPSGEELPPAFIAADEALVALELEMTVFNVEREEHASRIARKEIGQRLENIPLEVIQIEEFEDEDEDEEDGEADEDTADDADADDDDNGTETSENNSDSSREDSAESDEDANSDDEILPEFEDLVE